MSVFLAIAAAVAGCTAFDVFRPSTETRVAASRSVAAQARPAWTPHEPPARIAFNHKFHLGRGPGCADCHEKPEASGKMSMPDVEFCMNCHEDIDAKKPKEKNVAAFLDAAGKPRWSDVTAQGPDVVFSHEKHLAKKLECAECHKAVEESEAVGPALFLSMDACVKCHEAKQAKNDCATCHRAAAKSVAEGKGPYFAPANHDMRWRADHGPISRLATPRIQSETCDDCHAKADFPETGRCDTCHAATKPADHAAMWKDLHGQSVRRDPQAVTARCAFCHEKSGFPAESRCIGCHRTEAPRDHTQSWRTAAGHGLSASMDRARCAACHTTDSCQACHATVTPRSHRAGWGSPRDRHCTGCHLPLKSDSVDGCGACHQGTPSHASAPPMPSEPPHRPDMTCRKCHTPGRLKHEDNGTNCVTCHR